MHSTPHLEREIKLPVSPGAQWAALRQHLSAAGGVRVRPASLEENRVYEPVRSFWQTAEMAEAAETFKSRGQLLRLRLVNGSQRLTYKGTAEFEGPEKTREEIEVEVSSFEDTHSLLQRIGYQPALCYQKVREDWQLGCRTVSLDAVLFGFFVEIEGDNPSEVARQLGLDPDSSVRESYLELWDQQRARDASFGRDLVFPEDTDPLALFEAGELALSVAKP